MSVAEPPRDAVILERAEPHSKGMKADFAIAFRSLSDCSVIAAYYRASLGSRGFTEEEGQRGRNEPEDFVWSRGKYCSRLRCVPHVPGEDTSMYVLSMTWARTRIGRCK